MVKFGLLAEALLRGHALGEVYSSAIGDRDSEVAEKIRQAVREIAREHPHAKWYVPMGVGGHVDHRIARDAASEVLKEMGVRSVWGYEELFYAAEGGNGAPMQGGEKRPVEIKWKMELCRVYWSQFSAGRLKVLQEYAHRVGQGQSVERVWQI